MIRRNIQNYNTILEWFTWFALGCVLLLLTHWGRVTYICVGNLTVIGPDNGLSPGRCQAIIWTNDAMLFIGPLGTNFSEILIEIYTFSFKKMVSKVSSGKWRPSCLGLNVLTCWFNVHHSQWYHRHWDYHTMHGFLSRGFYSASWTWIR